MSKNKFQLGSAKTEVVRNTPPAGARGKTYRKDPEAKGGNYLIGRSLGCCLIWENLIGYL